MVNLDEDDLRKLSKEELHETKEQLEDLIYLIDQELTNRPKKDVLVNDTEYKQLPPLGVDYLITFSWECESKDNPRYYCVYNVEEDPNLDKCIYCGLPDERK